MHRKIDELLDKFTSNMTVFVTLMAALAYFLPGPFIALKPYMKLFFGITMFGIGVVLRPEDFSRVLKIPRIILIGMLSQFTIMPITAFVVSRIFSLPDAIAVGLIITGAAPGAMASNVICYIAGADVAYSVSLTSLSTLVTPIVTPLLVYFLAGSKLEVSFWEMFVSLLYMVVIPLGIGFAIRNLLKERIKPVLKIFPAISSSFIVFICALVIALNRDRLPHIGFLVIAAAVILNVNGMLMGYGIGKMANMSIKARRTLSIEIGMQNAGLGTVLALAHFGPEYALPTTAFVFICIFTATLMAGYWAKQDKKG